jgi:hypothetical protein
MNATTPENKQRESAISQETEKTDRPWLWKPGQSGNPTGRPKKKPLTEALEKIYSDPEECMAAARALAKKVRSGSIAHFQEAANRLDGRVSDTDESRGNVTFNVVISAPRPHKPDDSQQATRLTRG